MSEEYSSIYHINWIKTKIPQISTFAFHLLIILLVLLFARYEHLIYSAVCSFFLYFVIVGQSLRIGILRRMGLEIGNLELQYKVLVDILLSIVYTTALAITLSFLYAINFGFVITSIFVLISNFINLFAHTVSNIAKPIESINYINLIKSLGSIIICCVVGFFVIEWRFKWLEWPETTGSDLYGHVMLIRSILHYGGAPLQIGEYPSAFHAIMSLVISASGIDPYIAIGFGTFVTYPISLSIIYVFSDSILRSKWKSTLVAVFFPFVNEVGALLGPHYLYPSSYALVSVLLILVAIRHLPQIRPLQITILFAYSAVVFTYLYVILVSLPGLLYFWSHRTNFKILIPKIIQILLIVGIVGGLVFFISYYYLLPLLGIEPGFINTGIGVLGIAPFLGLSTYLFEKAYSTPLVCFLSMGLLALGISSTGKVKPLTRDFSDDRGLVLLTIFYLVVFFFPFRVSYRVDAFNRPLMFICMIVGASSLVGLVPNGLRRFGVLSYESWRGATPTQSFLVIIMLIIAIYPTVQAMDFSIKNDVHSPHIDEMNAFEWLQQNVPENGYVLADSATGLIMRAFLLRNISIYIMSQKGIYWKGVSQQFEQNLFLFFNSSPREEEENYKFIENEMGNVSFIVVSPRTSDWIRLRRTGASGINAQYQQGLGDSDPAWGKFFTPRYNVVKEFGRVRILVKGIEYEYFAESFNNVSNWYVDAGGLPQSDGEIGSYSNEPHPSASYHMYTNVPSLTSQRDLFIEVRYKSNVAGLEGRIYGYRLDDRGGGDAFFTGYIYPSNKWVIGVWALSASPFFREGPLQCISFGFHSTTVNWTLYIDYVRIFSREELDIVANEITYYQDDFENASLWNSNLGGLPKSDGEVGYYENSAHESNWYHMFTDEPSFITPEGLYLQVCFKSNTTGPEGRIFGYESDNRGSNALFFTELIRPSPRWTRKTWNLTDTLGYRNGSLQCISFGLYSPNKNWVFFVDFIRIYGMKEMDIIAEEIVYYHEKFDNVSLWSVNKGGAPQSESGVGYFENSAHSVNRYHMFTNTPSFIDQEGLYLRIRYKANVTGLDARVYGYRSDDREGGDAFYTDVLNPSIEWQTKTWRLTDTEGYGKGPLQCISFGVKSTNQNWKFMIDYVTISSYTPLNVCVREVMHYYHQFANVTTWEVNAGGQPQSNGTIGYYENSAHPVNWYHMYTNEPSFNDQSNLYLQVRFCFNTTKVTGCFFGYKNSDREGGIEARAFYTEYISASTSWTTKSWFISATPGYISGPLECISFGLYSSTANWTFYVDYVRLYSLEVYNCSVTHTVLDYERSTSDLAPMNVYISRNESNQAQITPDTLENNLIHALYHSFCKTDIQNLTKQRAVLYNKAMKSIIHYRLQIKNSLGLGIDNLETHLSGYLVDESPREPVNNLIKVTDSYSGEKQIDDS